MKRPEQRVGAHTVLVEVQTFPPKTRTVSVAVPKTYSVLVEVEELPGQYYGVLVECPDASATNCERSWRRPTRNGEGPKSGNDKR